MPKISVVIPTYNRASLLKRSVQSVLNQTYQDFEIIVVDDASTDNTKDVVMSFYDQRIKYIRHERNKGVVEARNTGLKYASGKYIAYQDSDDKWLAEKLRRQMDILEDAPSEIGVVYTEYLRIVGDKKIRFMAPEVIKRGIGSHRIELLKGNFIGTPTTLIKKECFEKAGTFDERLPQLEDWEMWIRISQFYDFRYINQPLVLAYHTGDNISSKQDTVIKALEMILEKHYEEFSKDKEILAKYQYWIGSLLCQIGQIYQGREYISKAIKLEPLNIKYLTAIFVSLFGKDAYNKVAKLKRRIQPGWGPLGTSI